MTNISDKRIILPDGSESAVNESSRKRLRQQRMKKIRRRRMMTSLYILAVIGSILFFLFGSPFNIKNMQFEGNAAVTDEQLRIASDLTKRDNLFRADLKNAAKEIMKIPYINHAEISRIFPNTVVIRVQEADIGGYFEYRGNYVYIDKEGKVLDVSRVKPEDVPLLKCGELPNVIAPGNTIYYPDYSGADEEVQKEQERGNKKLHYVISIIKILVNRDMLKDVSEISIDDDLEGEMLYMGRMRVNMGSIDNLDYEFSFFRRILENFDGNIVDSSLNLTDGVYKELD